MKKISIALAMSVAMVLCAIVRADDHVKLTGYLVDVMCADGHMKSHPENAESFGASHTKSCALDDQCAGSGFGIISGGKWYVFDAKGNELAKALFEKTKKNDHISATVEGVQQDNRILVEKLTEIE